MKSTTIIIILLMSSVSYAEGIYIDRNGALQITGIKEWRFSDFEKLGYEVVKDYEVYLSEGVLSDSKDNYNISIINNKSYIAYFEIIDKKIWRGTLLSKNVPIFIRENTIKLHLGVSLEKATKVLGKFENIGSGEESGNYLSFPALNKVSFYTSCSLNNPYEQTDVQKKMTEKELYDYCEIETMLFFGNSGAVSYNE